MYATTLAFAYALEPSSVKNKKKTLFATMLFATGAIVGWPFALALSLPFVFEELFVHSGDQVDPSACSSWMISRWKRLFTAGLASVLIFVRGRWRIIICSYLIAL
jgi:alpha-1,2-mannosyltransferase